MEEQQSNINLMDIIHPDARQLIENSIIQSMSVIDWGKAMARCNEIMQKDLLCASGIEAYDPETDKDCPKIDTTNNSPGFDILIKKDEKLLRIQSKLRQVKGINEYSCQINITTSRRRDNQREVPYEKDDFDYLFII